MRRLSALLLPAVLSSAPAMAGDHRVAPVSDPLVVKECGDCHMAFQPAFLPARSWERIMDGLADHFGDDAGLPPDKAAAVRAYLTANAGDGGGGRAGRKLLRGIGGEAPLRITGTPYFRHEHGSPFQRWSMPRVQTMSNCPACHRGAKLGWYDDD